ncbi:MAG: hypothetical protein GY785_25975 [Gammaproteobacteria bacterium]|nr:hypothetical protein [Gammaproteobacteria bacterium]
MNTETRHAFYASKPRILHMALNITLAPILLYLLGVWSWPPLLPHYIVFAITALMALHYARRYWSTPRLILDEAGLHCGDFYATDDIYKAKPAIRSVVLTILRDGKVKDKVISLGWSSRVDYRIIVQLLEERFQRDEPK